MDQNRHDDNLSLLGQSKATQYPTDYAPQLLESFVNLSIPTESIS